MTSSPLRPFPITDDCVQEILTFFSHLISPLTLTNLVTGCFDFSSLSNPLPVALHDGQAQYCAWHLQPALVGSSFPSSVICNLMSVTRTSSKSNHPVRFAVFIATFIVFMRFWWPESHCFGCVKILFVIRNISKSPHKERQILWHLNVVYYLYDSCYCS